MKKRLLYAAAAALMLAGCSGGAGTEEESDGYIAVYREIGSENSSETVTTSPSVSSAPYVSSDGYEYLSNALILGDGLCGQAVDLGIIKKENTIFIAGASPHNILDYKINGTLVSDLAKAADKPYIYLWFGDKEKFDELSPEEYGRRILSLAERLRELCPKSMVIPLSAPPLPEGTAHAGEIPDFNDALHLAMRSTPDVYIIYMDVFQVCADRNYFLKEEYSDGDGNVNSAGQAEIFRFIERDRFYNDMADEGDKFAHLVSKRPEYTVTEGKVAYLTFDDGPSKYTPEILEILRKNDIKATFFITGWCIEGKEATLRQVAEEGHTIGLHSWLHDYDAIYASKKAWLEDFNRVYNKVYAITGQKAWSFRFPGGSYNNYNKDTADEIIEEMKNRGFAYYDWNSATSDATVSATYESCLENIHDSIDHDHEVVLMHDSLKITPEYLQDVIDYIREQGYSFETIDTADEIHF